MNRPGQAHPLAHRGGIALDRLREHVATLDDLLSELAALMVGAAYNQHEPADARIGYAAYDVGGALHHLRDYLEGRERQVLDQAPRVMTVDCCGACEAHCGERCAHAEALPQAVVRIPDVTWRRKDWPR